MSCLRGFEPSKQDQAHIRYVAYSFRGLGLGTKRGTRRQYSS